MTRAEEIRVKYRDLIVEAERQKRAGEITLDAWFALVVSLAMQECAESLEAKGRTPEQALAETVTGLTRGLMAA